MGQKMTRSKKVVLIKNQFLHARQPREGIFEVRWYWGLIFTIVYPSFYLNAHYDRDAYYDTFEWIFIQNIMLTYFEIINYTFFILQ